LTLAGINQVAWRGSSNEIGFLTYGSSTDAGAVQLSSGGAAKILFDAAGASYINTGSNFGIGTSSPTDSASFSRALDVNGPSGAAVYVRTNNSASNYGYIGHYGTTAYFVNASAGPMAFYTNGSERARILSSGGITFNGDTATANALDDYEQGTHNPSVGCSTSGTMGLNASRNTLQYTKIGNWVNVQGYVEINSVSSGVGHVTLSMPFANQNDSEYSGVSMGSIIVSASSNPLNCDRYALYMQQGSSSVSIYATDGSTLQNDSAENITTAGGADLYLNISYRTQ
jgi:hypothetical protein